MEKPPLTRADILFIAAGRLPWIVVQETVTVSANLSQQCIIKLLKIACGSLLFDRLFGEKIIELLIE